MKNTDFQHEYEKLKAQAEVLAGGLTDIPRRVAILTNIYLDSGYNSRTNATATTWTT